MSEGERSDVLDGRSVVVTGGTGSLGQVLVRRLLSGEMGTPRRVVVFSRDEAKQHHMRLAYRRLAAATDEVIYHNFEQRLQFVIGDIRDYPCVAALLNDADVVFNAAALKQVPTCEYFPSEAVRTNIQGAENIVRAIRERRLDVDTVVGISTDKAAKPVNVMGMTKALQERILLQANLDCPGTRLVCVRYGNVLASRGSVIPLFLEQIRHGGPLTLTDPQMTRFLLSLDDAVDTVFAAVCTAERGETYVPRARSARMEDLAEALIGHRPIETRVLGVRPGEKLHEILISEEEAPRSRRRDGFFAILPILPELRAAASEEEPALQGELSSADHLMSVGELVPYLDSHGLLPGAPEAR